MARKENVLALLQIGVVYITPIDKLIHVFFN